MTQLPNSLAITGRVQSFINNELKGVLPVSCTSYMWHADNFKSNVKFISKALRTGAGVNVHLDNFRPSSDSKRGSFSYYLDEDHPDFTITLLSEPEYNRSDYDLVLYVSDSMEEDNQSYLGVTDKHLNSIEKAAIKCYHLAQRGASVCVDVSHLRSKGVVNQDGMQSSGPLSFVNILRSAYRLGKDSSVSNLLTFISSFNQELRRGGVYKNGAITTSMPCWSSAAKEYLSANPLTHNWLKRSLVLSSDYRKFVNIKELISLVNTGRLFLEKAVMQSHTGYYHLSAEEAIDNQDERVYSNVCREILFKPNSSCLLSHVNLGILSIENFQDEVCNAYLDGIRLLISLHAEDHPGKSDIGYLSAKEDMQVGLGSVGLANLLALHGVTYADFVKALKHTLSLMGTDMMLTGLGALELPIITGKNHATILAYGLCRAHAYAARVANDYGLLRAFTVAPTASCAYRYLDAAGNTLAPNIAAPLYRVTERLSQTIKDTKVYYHGEVETAQNVGFETHFELFNTWQQMFNETGLGHSLSFDLWGDIDEAWLDKWSESNLITTYYKLDIETGHLDKTNINPLNQCSACAE